VNHDGRIISPLSRLPESPALVHPSRERRVQLAVPRIIPVTTDSWIQGRSETRTIRYLGILRAIFRLLVLVGHVVSKVCEANRGDTQGTLRYPRCHPRLNVP